MGWRCCGDCFGEQSAPRSRQYRAKVAEVVKLKASEGYFEWSREFVDRNVGKNLSQSLESGLDPLDTDESLEF